jgi:hypothetical protein
MPTRSVAERVMSVVCQSAISVVSARARSRHADTVLPVVGSALVGLELLALHMCLSPNVGRSAIHTDLLLYNVCACVVVSMSRTYTPVYKTRASGCESK